MRILQSVSSLRWICLGCCLSLAACRPSDSPSPGQPPATTAQVAHETELLRLTLTPEAEQRLGLTTTAVGVGALSRVRTVHGEIVVPPLVSGGVPTRSATDLAALAANQSRADGDVARARAELAVAEKAALRAEALVREEAGSVRTRDEALSAQAVARATLDAALAQRRLLGEPVASLGQKKRWVRAAALASDLSEIDRDAPANVHALGARSHALNVHPIKGPSSADPIAGTVDFFYELDPADDVFRFGQRVSVDLPLKDNGSRLLLPASAIVRDIYGGEWVYVQSAPQTYERRRIEVAAVQGGQALLNRGLTQGTPVVTAGAAELFGTEFGAK